MFNYHSDVTTGYHLFLEPEGEVRKQLQDVITELSRVSEGPIFTPHITLLARIPDQKESILVEKTNNVARAIKKQRITLKGTSMQDSYYRALYLQIPDKDELETIHTYATGVFGMTSEQSYLPHLSLLYGNYSQAQKEVFLSTVQVPSSVSFQVTTIHLYKTSGKPHQWNKIYSCSLV